MKLNGGDPTRAALEELVACKDLKNKCKALYNRDGPSIEWHAHAQEYRRRQPLAWHNARKVLAETEQMSPESIAKRFPYLTDLAKGRDTFPLVAEAQKALAELAGTATTIDQTRSIE